MIGLRFYLYIGLACLALGYLKGCTDEKDRHAAVMADIRVMGEAADKARLNKITQDRINQQRIGERHAQDIKDRDRKYAALEQRLLDNSSGRIVPPAESRPGQLVPDGSACFNAERLDDRIRAASRRLLEGVARILRVGEDGVGEASLWREWASGAGSCPPPGAAPSGEGGVPR